jgi:DNA-binding LytR/AlgR family response regulator
MPPQMNAPTAVLAEDEVHLRTELREALHKLWPELVICSEAGDGFEALQALHQHAPQIMFLDIQMPGLSGLEVARQASGKSNIVFISAYERHAIEAFERGAIDYVQKPLSAARLSTTIERLKQRLQRPPADLGAVAEVLRRLTVSSGEYLKWLSVPYAGEVRLIMIGDVCYLRADNKYTAVATATAQFLLSSTLKLVKDKLDPQTFWQIHRSVVVNVAAIRAVHRTFRGALEVTLKERPEVLPVSAPYAHLFKHL